MKILLCHNRYQFPGGEDTVMKAEADLFRGHGHDVVEYIRHNDEIKEYGLMDKALLFLNTTWSKKSYHQVKDLCRKYRPDLAHFHNTLPLISPSAYYACNEEGVPVVQTLHNYRLICPGALFMREERVCEECASGDLRPALRYKCYRNSYIQTRAIVRMLKKHRQMGTYDSKISKYFALTEFGRNKLIEGGLPAEKIVVKSNFISTPPEPQYGGDYAVYVGRLSREKGVHVLVNAWSQIENFTLKMVGDGPMRGELENTASSRVEFPGQVQPEKVLEILSGARFLVLPSVCYEAFPTTVIEAFACGKPAVVSNMGAMAEQVDDGGPGLLFEPGNAGDLAAKARQLIDDPGLSEELGRNARAEFDAKYTPEKNYGLMMEIYSSLIKNE